MQNEIKATGRCRKCANWTQDGCENIPALLPCQFKDKDLAKWLGVSKRTLIRKARTLGLQKKENFCELRKMDIAHLSSEALKRMPSDTRFKKGERHNPKGEFKPGHSETPETRAKRIASLKETWRRKKLQQKYESYKLK